MDRKHPPTQRWTGSGKLTGALKGPQCEFMDSGNGFVNCANYVKPLRGVLGVESESMVWVQG